jgi:DNA invertase Pin-like site-specific DNA recombinase
MAHVPSNLYVILLRVSTAVQGAEGHGVAAQRRDIELFLKQQEGAQVVAELVEVESGAAATRPVLDEALNLCRRHHATLLVQKVDRLSRDLEVLARIVKDRQVPVKVACLPHADNFQIHLFGCLAAQEREFISTRTKAALQAAKARGVKLGNPRLAELNQSRTHQARNFSDQYSTLIWSLRNKGKSLRQICSVLNDAGMKTARGSTFNPIQVSRILKRTEDACKSNL